MSRWIFLVLSCGLVFGDTDFTKDVQPILERNCYGCHGAKAQMGGLRLDQKADKVIVTGHPDESALYQRIAGIGEGKRMPMGGKPLPAEQIAVIKAWITEGAKWPETAATKKHWAFIPPVKPNVPNASVDYFIKARLDKEGLSMSPEADRATLLRRLSLDLIGLPPTTKELDEFLKDGNYEKQVDRLLASPHYGEKWGRYWLDAARYADSDGYEKDKQRTVWFYRDWVIRALNRDLPYNQFIVEQLAGDLLPNATQDQKVATGFLRNSMINEEGGVDPEQFRMEAMFDRMDAIGKSMLGVTIQCAQCHNHKFDPLKQEEYYKIFAFLNNSHEGSIAVYTPEEDMKRAEVFRKTGEIEERLKHASPTWEARMQKWADGIRASQPQWTVLKTDVDDISTGGQKYLPMKDGSLLAQGYAPTKHKVKLTVKTAVKDIRAFRLELMMDPNLPFGGPGRSIQGTAALTEFEVEAVPANKPDEKPTPVKFVKATADFNPPERPLAWMYDDKSNKCRVTGPIEFAIDGKDETAWGTDAGRGLRNQPRNAVFVADKPIGFEGGTILNIYLKQNHGGWNSDDNQSHNLGRFRLSMTTAADAVAMPDLNFRTWRTLQPEWKDANDQIAKIWEDYPEGSSQLVLNQRDDMRETHILQRGDFLKPGREVTPGVPSFLNPLPEGAPANRLTFAKWMTDRQAPTTARSIVNRVWQQYFGTGIVATSEDLGTQCEPPTHPELLDWLAVEFMDQGWSLKKLHRTIVMSAVYKQSSKVTPELYAKDPYNRLLARGPRFRVEAELVRDIALSASGLLNEKVGGPSVYPPAPDFLFQPPVSYGPKVWDEDKGADRYRRALYTFRYRSVPYPVLQNFDAPNGDISCVRRSRSNTPLQALTTLNEPLFLEAAKALAARVRKEGGKDDAARIGYGFRLCTSRKPTADEAGELNAFLSKQKTRLGEDAAWMALSRVLLNLDETITKE